MNLYCDICGRDVGKNIKGEIRKDTVHICKSCNESAIPPSNNEDDYDFSKEILNFFGKK